MIPTDTLFARSNEAAAILENPLFIETLSTLRNAELNKIVLSQPEQTSVRDAAYYTIKGIDVLTQHLEQMKLDYQLQVNAESRKPKSK